MHIIEEAMVHNSSTVLLCIYNYRLRSLNVVYNTLLHTVLAYTYSLYTACTMSVVILLNHVLHCRSIHTSLFFPAGSTACMMAHVIGLDFIYYS